MPAILITDADNLGQAMRSAIQSIDPTTACIVTESVSSVTTDSLLCPLTLGISPDLEFWGQDIFNACRQTTKMQQWVAVEAGLSAGVGTCWLPIVNTRQGVFYAAAVSQTGDHYQQPFHLQDQHRQPLYQLAAKLLDQLQAPPAVYLLAFGLIDGKLVFDRLLPFPAAPALASINVQQPDLFACHWRCLTNRPILELLIASQSSVQELPKI
jgi:hypothetical protein